MLAATGVQIYLYLSHSFKEYGAQLQSQYPNVHIIGYVEPDMSFLVEPNISFPLDKMILPQNRNAKKDTVDYFCIQLMKLALMASTANIVKTSHLAWIDFGIFHMFKDISGCSKLLQEIEQANWPSDLILSPGCWPATKQYPIWKSICWVHCGSFLLGARGLFLHAYSAQQSLVVSNLPALTWEVNYWSKMNIFQTYLANHNDSILKHLMQYALL